MRYGLRFFVGLWAYTIAAFVIAALLLVEMTWQVIVLVTSMSFVSRVIDDYVDLPERAAREIRR